MVSTDSNLGKTKQRNLSKNLVDDGSETKENSWITDDIPVTIFRFSNGSQGLYIT